MVAEINIDFIGRSIDIGGPSTEWWSQLATAVAGGLAFATLLTLVLTPCMLALKARSEMKKQARLDARLPQHVDSEQTNTGKLA